MGGCSPKGRPRPPIHHYPRRVILKNHSERHSVWLFRGFQAGVSPHAHSCDLPHVYFTGPPPFLLGALDAVLITVAQACGLQSDLREHIFAGNIVVTLTYMEPG